MPDLCSRPASTTRGDLVSEPTEWTNTPDPIGIDADDDTQELPRPEGLDAIDAYNRALTAFGVELDDLGQSIGARDLELVAVTAHDASLELIAADAAYRRLVHRFTGSDSLLEVLRFGITERQQALLRLIECAQVAFQDSKLQNTLMKVREAISIAFDSNSAD